MSRISKIFHYFFIILCIIGLFFEFTMVIAISECSPPCGGLIVRIISVTDILLFLDTVLVSFSLFLILISSGTITKRRSVRFVNYLLLINMAVFLILGLFGHNMIFYTVGIEYWFKFIYLLLLAASLCEILYLIKNRDYGGLR